MDAVGKLAPGSSTLSREDEMTLYIQVTIEKQLRFILFLKSGTKAVTVRKRGHRKQESRKALSPRIWEGAPRF